MRTGSPPSGDRGEVSVRRDQLEHLIRAAGDLLQSDTIIVIGSQAILATVPEPADEMLTRSMEADLLPLDDDDEAKADLIDGVLGAGSMFDDTHGVHGDGVTLKTAVLPAGWRDRLVEIANENTGGVRGLCLEPHDLVISKLAAGRGKDLEFCAAAVTTGIVERAIVEERLSMTAVSDDQRRRMRRYIDAW
jgi:hypothetical protein